MNILSVQNYNLSNFAPQQIQKQNQHTQTFGLFMQKPLNKDTLSFKGSAYEISKTMINGSDGVSMATAKRIYEIIEPKQIKVKNFLNKYFSDLIATEQKPKNPIAYVADVAKQPMAIFEKCAAGKISDLNSALRNITDLNRGKIVVLDDSKKQTRKIIDRLISAIKNEDVRLVEVEIKRPKPNSNANNEELYKYDYFSIDDIEELVEAGRATGRPVRYDNNPKPTKFNYSGVHFLFRYPNTQDVFEIQLYGTDVDKYKKLDDLFYKIFGNKGVNKKYKPLIERMDRLKDFEYKDGYEKPSKKIHPMDNFNQYRRDVFLFQREKMVASYKNAQVLNVKFPPSKYPFSEDPEINDMFDMTNLYNLMIDCELKAEKTGRKRTN